MASRRAARQPSIRAVIPLQPVQSSKPDHPDASINRVSDPSTAAYVLLEELVDGDLNTAPMQERLASVSAAIEMVVEVARRELSELHAAHDSYIVPGEKTREVFKFLRKGWSVEQISLRLCISEATVRYHIRKIIKAYGASSYDEAISIAERNETLGK